MSWWLMAVGVACLPVAAFVLGLVVYLLSCAFAFGWYIGSELFAWMGEE